MEGKEKEESKEEQNRTVRRAMGCDPKDVGFDANALRKHLKLPDLGFAIERQNVLNANLLNA